MAKGEIERGKEMILDFSKEFKLTSFFAEVAPPAEFPLLPFSNNKQITITCKYSGKYSTDIVVKCGWCPYNFGWN